MKVEFSWRYCVVGIYADRRAPQPGWPRVWRVYPAPFIRVSFGGVR